MLRAKKGQEPKQMCSFDPKAELSGRLRSLPYTEPTRPSTTQMVMRRHTSEMRRKTDGMAAFRTYIMWARMRDAHPGKLMHIFRIVFP